MDDEVDVLLFERSSLWKPPVPLSDCTSEYMKDNPIPYHLLQNPFKTDDGKPVSEEYEQRLWSRLGLLNDTDPKYFKNSVAEDEAPSIEGNLYFAKSIPPIISKRGVKRERRAERKAKLEKWFDLPRGDLTKENQEDLEIITKRSILAADLHTRKADGRRSHFVVGTVVDDPASFHDRIPRKERKKTLVDELLANAAYMKKQRRQYIAIQREKQEKRAAAIRKKKQMQRKAGRVKTVELKE